jgi:uncharacterized protein (TIGR02246 family)
MPSDEVQIRELVAAWMKATREKDPDTVLSLMTDDVRFLVSGRPPFGKDVFEKAARSQAADDAPSYDASSDIREIHVEGSMAYAISQLTLLVTPTDGSPAMRREGYTLTVFRKVDRKWLLARDANLLSPPPKPA